MSVQLLVSVRSTAEALEALAGGASLIDVKEPSRGPMGRADASVIEEVVRAVAGRRPVSAALGELSHLRELNSIPCGLSFLKWGLAGCAERRWVEMLPTAHEIGLTGICKVVVAYADEEEARVPPLGMVADFVCGKDSGWGLLVDTCTKKSGSDRPTLLDYLDVTTLGRLCERCRAAGVPVALAGSLGAAEVRRLVPLGPDWIGVRGAVCAGHDRNQSVNAKLVEEIAALVRVSSPG